jgi:hypothetical protein
VKDKIARKEIEAIKYGRDGYLPSLMTLGEKLQNTNNRLDKLIACLSAGKHKWALMGKVVACEHCGMIHIAASENAVKFVEKLNKPKKKGH